MANQKPTLHHLNNSQSQRIIWLLEELSIPYNLVLHERNPPSHPTRPFLSPQSLLDVSPSGKSPTLILPSGRAITESSAIATYLIRTYDTSDKFGLQNGDWIKDEMLVSIIISVLGKATTNLLMLDMRVLRTGVKKDGSVNMMWDGVELRRALKEVEVLLGDDEWFGGKGLSRADFLMEFPVGSVKARKSVDLEKEFPKLNAWLGRVYARDAWKRGIEKGNGYDMGVFPKFPRL